MGNLGQLGSGWRGKFRKSVDLGVYIPAETLEDILGISRKAYWRILPPCLLERSSWRMPRAARRAGEAL